MVSSKKWFRRNLAALPTSCYAQKKLIRLLVLTFGLVIYSGICPQRVLCARMPSPKHFPWIGTWSVGLLLMRVGWQCGEAYEQRAGGAAEVEGHPCIQKGEHGEQESAINSLLVKEERII
jgi:hypothetical protein